MENNGKQKIRILLADDHVLVREGTRELLAREKDMVVVAEAGNGNEAVQLAQHHRPDVALMDIAMPELNGIEATRQIKTCCPSITVLVLTAYDDDPYVFALLEAGAAGYLLKNVRGHCLVEAIRAVHAGESVLAPAIARKVIERFAHPQDEKAAPGDGVLDRLTDREIEVITQAAKGKTNQEIADHLSLSVRTVQAHLSAVFNKLQVGSRTEAVVRALQLGWLTLEDTL